MQAVETVPLAKPKPKGGITMRFMVLVKADKNSEAGVLPDEKLLTEMGKYNEELAKAGVLLAGRGSPAELEGSTRPVFRGQTDRDRWALSQHKGAHRRILAVAGELEERGD
jgi:YCII-related domain